LTINMFKVLGLLSPDGAPAQRYFEFLNQSQSGRVLAEALEEAYADLYQLHTAAHDLPRNELVGKIKTLTQGQASDSVVGKMTSTFLALAKLADFEAARPAIGVDSGVQDQGATSGHTPPDGTSDAAPGALPPTHRTGLSLGGLVYNIELHLPDSRDPAVYDALFQSLKSHLLS